MDINRDQTPTITAATAVLASSAAEPDLGTAALALFVLWAVSADEDRYLALVMDAITAVEDQYEEAIDASRDGDFHTAARVLLG